MKAKKYVLKLQDGGYLTIGQDGSIKTDAQGNEAWYNGFLSVENGNEFGNRRAVLANDGSIVATSGNYLRKFGLDCTTIFLGPVGCVVLFFDAPVGAGGAVAQYFNHEIGDGVLPSVGMDDGGPFPL